MGAKESKLKYERDKSRHDKSAEFLDDEEYLKMIKRKRERDAAKHD